MVFIHGFTGHPEITWTFSPKPSHGMNTGRRSGGELSGARVTKSRWTPLPLRTRKQRLSANFIAESSQTTGTNGGTAPNSSVPQAVTVFWPRDLVPMTLPHSRVMTYGYDTDVRHIVEQQPLSENTLFDHGWDFACSVEAARSEKTEQTRPLIFVAHSLGGLVTAEALRRAYESRSIRPTLYNNICAATTGLIFFGTPHGGADPRSSFHCALTRVAELAGFRANPEVVQSLKPDLERSRRLRMGFLQMAHTQKWSIFSFQEEYGVRLLGRKVCNCVHAILIIWCGPFNIPLKNRW